MNTFKKLLKCEAGATAIEYGLIVGAIGLAVAVGLSQFGEELSNNFNTAGGKITEQVNKIQPAAGQ